MSITSHSRGLSTFLLVDNDYHVINSLQVNYFFSIEIKFLSTTINHQLQATYPTSTSNINTINPSININLTNNTINQQSTSSINSSNTHTNHTINTYIIICNTSLLYIYNIIYIIYYTFKPINNYNQLISIH